MSPSMIHPSLEDNTRVWSKGTSERRFRIPPRRLSQSLIGRCHWAIEVERKR